jgi:hypothetical protein
MNDNEIDRILKILKVKGVDEATQNEIANGLKESTNKGDPALANWLKNPTISIKNQGDLSTITEEDDLPIPSEKKGLISESHMVENVNNAIQRRKEFQKSFDERKHEEIERIKRDEELREREWKKKVAKAEKDTGK